MLDDFKASRGGTGRWGASLVASAVLYGAVGAGVVAASSVAHHALVEDELVQVEFAPLPEAELPPPPPPSPPPVATPRPEAPPARLGRPRPELAMPDAIPEARPAESDRALAPPPDPFAPEAEGDPNGTLDGVVGGVPGGAGTAVEAAVVPPPAPEPTRPRGPVRVVEGSTPPQVDREELVRNFDIPAEVRSAGLARITVVVRVTVGEDGRVGHVEVLRGHALIPDDVIVRAVERSHFTPARMSDGAPYAAIHTLPITLAITL